jgi:Tol biopolymer transport system component/tRNA A-37 threonylcarbamoyl transferase component Bud32
VALSPGSRVGIYEVIAPIGRGGMGEVYRARDPKLQRDVAIKALPEAFSQDRDRLLRFEREARLLASLNHSNIAAIHGLEEQDGSRFLVMELVEGQTLDERIAEGPLPLEETLAVAAQIAAGLEAAHEAGIIHRDLKPSNVKIRPGGSVKVLDLGLARTVDGAGALDSSLSPTRTTPATLAGAILGTAAYMSPEQARGKPLDKRSDIFSFGCVVYECLTGRQAFSGETVTDILSAILSRDPDWSALPAGTPAKIRDLLRRCLQKDPKRRLHDIADARLEIEEAQSRGASGEVEPGESPRPAGRGRMTWAIAGALAGAVLAAAATMLLRDKAPAAPAAAPLHAVLPLGAGDALFTMRPSLALSPDGRTVVYSAIHNGVQTLFRRPLASDHAEAIQGTELGSRPFFSPNGQWVGFIAKNELRKVPLLGGAAVTLSNIPPVTAGGSWGTDGRLVLPLGANSGLYAISEAGGDLTPFVRLDEALGEHALLHLQILPGGRGILCTQRLGIDFADLDRSNVVVIDPATGKRNTVIEGATFARYGNGRLAFLRGATVFTAPFDLSRLAVTGAAVPVAEKIAIDPSEGVGLFALAAGTLAFVDGEPVRLPLTSVVRLDREGKSVRLPLPPGAYFNPRLSPDGKRLAMVQFFGLRSAIVIYDRERDIVSTLTPERGRFFCPLWSPDGKRVAFSRMGGARPTLGIKNADGSGEIQSFQKSSEDAEFPGSFSPDGKTIAYTINYSADRGGTRKPISEDIWLQSVDGTKPAPVGPWFEAPAREAAPAISPDGKWVAYVSDESGAKEIYVRPYPGPGVATKVSPDSGIEPAWTRGGRELIYRAGERYERFMVIEVANALPAFSAPRLLFTTEVNIGGQWSGRGSREEAFRDYDVSADGNTFYATQFVPTEEPPRQLVVVTDWAATVPR